MPNCVIKSAMKKLLLGCLILLTACQPTATPTPAPSFFPTETPLPTPIPATFTPAPTFTPEPSPTPLPRFFTNEFDASLAGWVILQAGNQASPNITTESSHLTVQMDAPHTWVYALYGAEDYSDVRIDTSFEFRQGTESTVGLICRYSEEKGWLEFNIANDGSYNILYGTWLDTGVADYIPVISGTSEYIKLDNSQQEIGLNCKGTVIELYINGKLFRNMDVSRFEVVPGKVGFTVSSFENAPVITSFDKVTVSETVP
ncbi:MAG: hypothetical protein QM730_00980 [Anaerolineales bacterium]